MTMPYKEGALLHVDPIDSLDQWYHEGVGRVTPLEGGGMCLHCFGSRQGAEGCQAFFRPTLPDNIAVEYELIVRSHGGLIINFLALRGLGGEDLIEDRHRLRPRTGKFVDYVSAQADLQSFHVSISRFHDEAKHSGTSNWRRNPGLVLVGHGEDRVTEIGRPYRIRLVKDRIHLQLFVDGHFAHAAIDRYAGPHGIPDSGKFGFRLIGRDVRADVRDFRVVRVEPDTEITSAMQRSGLL